MAPNDQMRAMIQSESEQAWEAATDWAISCFTTCPNAFWALHEIAKRRDVISLRSLDDHTLQQVCNIANLTLLELTKRAYEKMESNP